MVDALTKGLSLIPGLGDIATNLGDSYRESGGIAGLVFDPEAIEKKGNEAANKLKNQLTKLKKTRGRRKG